MTGALAHLPAQLVQTRLLIDRQLALWPEHEAFLNRSFAERDADSLRLTEEIAAQIVTLAGDELPAYCRGYRWMCDAMLEEELFFRRHGRYQAQSFADVARAIYDDRRVMRLYMDGLLLSQVFWRNHVDIAKFFRAFVERLPARFDLLEIGPGHGLQLAHAAMDAKCQSVTAWDISDASLAATRECLVKLAVTTPVRLEKRDIFDLTPEDRRYTAVVVSEVLEHLEDPARALRGIRECMRPGALAFINVPCNSPAPDHIHLFSHPDDFYGMLEANGFRIVDRYATPGTGWTLDRALRQQLTVSSAAIVRRTDDGQ
jgi:SAM-dependent methyltransferase